MLINMTTSILRWQKSKERVCVSMIAAIFSSLYLGEGPVFILPGYGSKSPSDSFVETESLQLVIERTETGLQTEIGLQCCRWGLWDAVTIRQAIMVELLWSNHDGFIGRGRGAQGTHMSSICLTMWCLLRPGILSARRSSSDGAPSPGIYRTMSLNKYLFFINVSALGILL